MNAFTEKAHTKTGIAILAVIFIVLIATITSTFIGNSNKEKSDIRSTEGNIAAVDVQKPTQNEAKPKVEVQSIVIAPQATKQSGSSEIASTTPELKQTEAQAPVGTIQEGQPKVESSPTPPAKPAPQGDITDKSVKPTYTEQEVNPQQSQPKMGDKNDKGQIWINGFGWVKDEGGGGKGTTVSDMKENGNKIGIMN